jgi:hypothetical protein
MDYGVRHVLPSGNNNNADRMSMVTTIPYLLYASSIASIEEIGCPYTFVALYDRLMLSLLDPRVLALLTTINMIELFEYKQTAHNIYENKTTSI